MASIGSTWPCEPNMSNEARQTSARQSIQRQMSRILSRALDSSPEVVWVLDAERKLIYFNRAAATWLGVADEALPGLRCQPDGEHPVRLPEVAACLAAPADLDAGGELVLTLQSPTGVSREVRFLRWGQGAGELFLAMGGAREVRPATTLESVERAHLREQLSAWRRHRSSWGGVVAAGVSRASARLRGQLQIAAEARHPFAIVEPRGCGGELIARRIHERSPRGGESADPLIVVDMPLMDAELLEATLSPGAAHLGGDRARTVTLLLRAVDESPLQIQDLVLEFAHRVPTSVRLIGLFRSGVAAAFAAGEVSDAMSQVMAVTEIKVEPLAARPEDIPLMAAALVEQRRAMGQGLAERISRAAMDLLLLYPWPDNFEELDAAIRHAVLACRSATIVPEDLPLAIRSFRVRLAQPPVPPEGNLDEALRRFELDKIRQSLEVADGNRSEAARRLGISRARLIRRLGESEAQDSV